MERRTRSVFDDTGRQTVDPFPARRTLHALTPDGSEILFSRPLQAGDELEGQKGAGGALRQE